MSSPTSSRERLLEFLDSHVFQSTLSAQPSEYADAADRKLLKSVQKRVQESRIRYVADYPTAADIKSSFLGDLNSKPGQALASDMWVLKLQRFEDVREGFLALCQELSV